MIYCVFPLCGKTYMANRLGADLVSDSDSSQFSWMIDENGNRVRNPEFPCNYIEHLKEVSNTHRYVFASTHKMVLRALDNAGLAFSLVHPRYDLKEEWLQRYDARKENGFPRKVLEDNWDQWFEDMGSARPHTRIVLEHGEYLDDHALAPNGVSFGPGGNVRTALYAPWRDYADAAFQFRHALCRGYIPTNTEQLQELKNTFENALRAISMPSEEAMATEVRSYCIGKISELRTHISNLKAYGAISAAKADLLLNVVHFITHNATEARLNKLSAAIEDIRLDRVK